MEKGRFAPSPSGRMHLGNVFAGLIAWLDAKSVGGHMVLRIEDLDQERCKPAYSEQLVDDLKWLGLDWQEGGNFEPYLQSKRTQYYDIAFDKLKYQGHLYPCWCTRGERLAVSAPHVGEERGVGRCGCYDLTDDQRAERRRVKAPAWKVAVPNQVVEFHDLGLGSQRAHLLHDCGDFIIRRADGAYGYQLAVVVDDGEMGITRVVRGNDLLNSTPWQIWLMETLGYQVPTYGHVPLLVAPDGRRLSKREKDLDLGALGEKYTGEIIVNHLKKQVGQDDFSWETMPKESIVVDDFFLDF